MSAAMRSGARNFGAAALSQRSKAAAGALTRPAPSQAAAGDLLLRPAPSRAAAGGLLLRPAPSQAAAGALLLRSSPSPAAAGGALLRPAGGLLLRRGMSTSKVASSKSQISLYKEFVYLKDLEVAKLQKLEYKVEGYNPPSIPVPPPRPITEVLQDIGVVIGLFTMFTVLGLSALHWAELMAAAPKEKQPASKEDEPAPKEDEPPSKEEEPPSKEDEKPSKEEEPPSKEEEPPSKEEEPPSKVEEPPSKEEEPPKEEEKPKPKGWFWFWSRS